MDDHLYNQVLEYAQCELIPRFKAEFEKVQKMADCASYAEMQALCTALNAIAPYAGYTQATPKDFI